MKEEEVEMIKKCHQAINMLMIVHNYYTEKAKQGVAEDEQKYLQLCKFAVKLNRLIFQLKLIFSDFLI